MAAACPTRRPPHAPHAPRAARAVHRSQCAARRARSALGSALETLTLTLSPMVRRMTLTGCPRLRSLSVLQRKRACKYPRLQDLAVPAATRTVRLPARCPRMREALRRVPSPAIVEI